ncbi:hypothetical protein D3C76_1527600 [compost metagenome]
MDLLCPLVHLHGHRDEIRDRHAAAGRRASALLVPDLERFFGLDSAGSGGAARLDSLADIADGQVDFKRAGRVAVAVFLPECRLSDHRFAAPV